MESDKELLLQDGYDFIVHHTASGLHFRLFTALLHSGICDLLEDNIPKTPKDIAKTLDLSEIGTHKLLRYFSFHKIFIENRSNGTYQKTKYSSILKKDSVHFGLANLLSGDPYFDLFKSIPHTFKNGVSGIPESLGVKSAWDILNSESNKKVFKSAMSSQTIPFIEDILKNIDFSQYNTIVDVGGSSGIVLEKIFEKFPNIEKGINYDLEKVININSKFKNPKLSHESGSFLESVPSGDCYILKHVLHDWNDENCIKILNNIGKSMLPNGKIYIFDVVIDEENYEETGLYFDCKMFHFFLASERTQNEFKILLDTSGFKIDKFYKRGLVASKK